MVQVMSVCGLEITMLKLRGWRGLTNNYFKAERLEWGLQITIFKLRGWSGLTNTMLKLRDWKGLTIIT